MPRKKSPDTITLKLADNLDAASVLAWVRSNGKLDETILNNWPDLPYWACYLLLARMEDTLANTIVLDRNNLSEIPR